MKEFVLDKKYIKEKVELVLETILDKDTHTLVHTDNYSAVTYKAGNESNIPNGDGYVISYGGILAEIQILEEDYGKYTVEEYDNVLTSILERTLESMYSLTIPAIVVMGV